MLGFHLTLTQASPLTPLLDIPACMNLTQLQSLLEEINWSLSWAPVPKDSLVFLFFLLMDKRPQDTVTITDDRWAIFLQFQEALNKVTLIR